MRKLYAILVTLLFVTSVFGVASMMADGGCPCDEQYYKISQTSVQVGDTFTLAINNDCLFDADIEDNFIWEASPGKFREMIWYDPKDIISENGWTTATFKALRPGTLTVTYDHGGCKDSVTITITSKEYPMNFFMKIIGFGKKK